MSECPTRRAALALSLGALFLAIGGCGGGGTKTYRPAIDLGPAPTAPEVYDDQALVHLQYVLTEERQAEYLQVSEADRAEWMRVVWGALDPTPTTEINERRVEHFRRLAYVQQRFAIDEPPGWDKRGELLLRYGTPDARREIPADIIEGLGLVPPKEVWVYYWLGQAYRLEDPRFQGNFQDHFELAGTGTLRASPRDIDQSRRDLEEERHIQQDQHFDQLREMESYDPETELAIQRMDSMLEQGQVAYREQPQAYLHDHGGERLDFVFDVLSFAGDQAGQSKLELNFAYWANDLGYFAAPTGGFDAVLGMDVVLKTDDYREVARRKQRTEDHKDSIDDLEGRIVVDQAYVLAAPGEYRLALSVRDSVSGDVGIFTTDVNVLEFPEGQLAISDLQLALDVRGGQPGDPFLKGPYQVVPYPLGTFPRDRDAYLFFEIYGLTASPTGDVLYTVEFLIRPQKTETSSWFGSSKGRVVPGVATAYDGTGKAGVAREWIVLDPATFTSDLYDVEVKVTDRVADREAARSVTFAVQS
jgi:GWxTD domain-containing protein